MKARAIAMATSVLLAGVLAGCGAAPEALAPVVPTFPVSFEANLLTAKQCAYKGIAGSAEQARRMGANLLLAFTYENATETHVESTQRAARVGRREVARRDEVEISVWNASGMQGKAVYCPKDAVEQVAALEGGSP